MSPAAAELTGAWTLCTAADYTSLISLGCSKTCCHDHRVRLGGPPQDAALRLFVAIRSSRIPLPHVDPLTVLTGSRWRGAAFPALNGTVCCSLVRSLHPQARRLSAHRAPHCKVHPNASIHPPSLPILPLFLLSTSSTRSQECLRVQPSLTFAFQSSSESLALL